MKILMLLNEAQPLRTGTCQMTMRVWRKYRHDLVVVVQVRSTLNSRAIHVLDILSARDTEGALVPFSDAEGTLRMARREHVSVLSVGELDETSD